MKLGKKLLSLCFVLIATLALSILAPATAAAKTGHVSTKVVNVRSGPGKTHKKVGTLKKGNSVNIVSTKSGWYKINYKGHTGYVNAKFIRSK